MKRRTFATAVFVLVAMASTVAGEAPDRDVLIRALIERSRFLDDATFEVPKSFYETYVREAIRGEPLPVGHMLSESRYAFSVPSAAKLNVRLELRVFDAKESVNLPLLTDRLIWKDVRINGKPVKPTLAKGWLCFTFTEAGDYAITAEADLNRRDVVEARFSLDVPRAVRTLVQFESPDAWQIEPEGDSRRIRGGAGGTHGEIALSPRNLLAFTCRRPEVFTERPPKLQVRGDVAWNLDAGMQQIGANVEIDILGGATDRLELRLPDDAERVSITGPDVREIQGTAGAVIVFLRGRIMGNTRLVLSYERPRKGPSEQFQAFTLADGRWTGGAFVITHTAGSTEVLAGALSGLRETALAEIPPSASAMLMGPPSLAYEITAPQWSAGVELLTLGEFALTESIADLAHYEVAVRPGGALMVKATWEVRNRHRQFLRLTLPKGAQVMLARVNEDMRHVIDIPGAKDACLLPLVRSMPSIEGLVSFPVEIVFLARVEAPGAAGGALKLPLPRIDIPIGYAWCEAWLPENAAVTQWSGALRRVDRFSSETAVASLETGSSELAEGYSKRVGNIADRPPEAPTTPTPGLVPMYYAPPTGEKKPDVADAYARARLARNYYRAGKDLYEANDYDAAASNLRKASELLPGSVEAENAKRLLGNIKAVAGELEAKTKEQRASLSEVKGALKGARDEAQLKQETYVEEGFKALREGKKSVAMEKLAAAEQMSKDLISKGDSGKEVSARMSKAREALKEVRSEQEELANKMNEAVKKLAAEGRYDEAIKKSEEIIKVAPQTEAAVRRNISALAVKDAKQRASSRTSSGWWPFGRRASPAGEDRSVEADVPAEEPRLPAPSGPAGDAVTQPAAGAGYGVMAERQVQEETHGGGEGRTETTTKTYDVGDLLGDISALEDGKFELQDVSGNDAPRNAPAARSSKENLDALQKIVTDTVLSGKAGQNAGGEIRTENGRLVVTHTPETQQRVQQLLEDLRRAQKPQVELGERITEERARGLYDRDEYARFGGLVDFANVAPGGRSSRVSEDLKRFIDANYRADWRRDGVTLADVPADSDIADALERNLGQKVLVSSINLNADASRAGVLGISFTEGNNGLRYAVVDEAQFRTLKEFSDRNGAPAPAEANPTNQDAIVGTPALTANGMVADVRWAGDAANDLDVRDNRMRVSHEQYLIIDNGRYLTAVRAGAMQFWTEASQPVFFASAPQEIDVPRAGRAVRFEKTLIEPDDELVIQGEIHWKGGAP